MPIHSTARALTLLVLLSGLSACSGATRVVHKLDPDKVVLKPTDKQDVRGTRATLEVPRGFTRASDRVWTLKQRKSVVLLLNVQRVKLPERGAERWLKRRIQVVQRSGQAGITRNEAVELGDLDARYVEAIDLVGRQRQVVYQVVAEGEDGMYIVSLYAPISLHKTHGKQLGTIVRSLRISR